MVSDADRLARNRAVWAAVNGQFTDADSDARWGAPDLRWGLFGHPEAELGLLGDVRGARVVELGCGTAFVSAALVRAGACAIAVDLSRSQLATASRCQRDIGPSFPLIEANAESVPLRSGCFDLVVSEYGASPWCEPARWIGEAARLLRRGGRLVFLTNSVLAGMCVPESEGAAGDRLVRSMSDLARIAWPGGGIEHHLSHGAWIEVLRGAGFVVDALHELTAPEHAVDPAYYEIVSREWASRWPAEDVWIAHLGGTPGAPPPTIA